MKLADVVDGRTAQAWAREQWADSAWVRRVVFDYQCEALAILLAHPEWAKGIPGSLFANEEWPELLALFRIVCREKASGEKLLESLCNDALVTDDELMVLWGIVATSPWASGANAEIKLRHAVNRLQQIAEWKYRQTAKTPGGAN